MRAESATTIRERLKFLYAHYVASVSFTPPRRRESKDYADKVAMVLEGLVRRADLFGTEHAGVEDGRLWVQQRGLLNAFEVPANIKREETYAGPATPGKEEEPLSILPAILEAFYPDPQKVYFLANARMTRHEEYASWVGEAFPAARLVNERWQRLAQQRAGISIADVPFLGVPLASSNDGRIWFVTRDELPIIEALRRYVQGSRPLCTGEIDEWVFGSRVARITRGGHRPLTAREVEVVWPKHGEVLQPDELHTFCARVTGTALGSYRMWYRGEGGSAVEMVNNDAAGYKECSQIRCDWPWRGPGPYALQFVAREPEWEEEGWALSKRVLVFLSHKGWRLPDEQERKSILQRWWTDTRKHSRFKSEIFPRP
ncbi:MAG TPA: hypothetical protein VGK29_03125 [Paludibaculum sp.]|jgi:hypothetical protein